VSSEDRQDCEDCEDCETKDDEIAKLEEEVEKLTAMLAAKRIPHDQRMHALLAAVAGMINDADQRRTVVITDELRHELRELDFSVAPVGVTRLVPVVGRP